MEIVAVAALLVSIAAVVVVAWKAGKPDPLVGDLVDRVLYLSERADNRYAELHARLMTDADVTIQYRKALNEGGQAPVDDKPTLVSSYEAPDFDLEEIGT